MATIYHLTTAPEWHQAKQKGRYEISVAPGQQFLGDRQRIGRLSRTRRRDEQEITLSNPKILCVSSFLPTAKSRKIRIRSGCG